MLNILVTSNNNIHDLIDLQETESYFLILKTTPNLTVHIRTDYVSMLVAMFGWLVGREHVLLKLTGQMGNCWRKLGYQCTIRRP